MRLSRRRTARWAIGIGIACGTLLFASVSTVRARLDAAPVFVTDRSPPAENPLHAEVKTQRQRIEEVIAHAPANEWSAEYYDGDGLGANIRITLDADAGVAATWHGCLGMYGANVGKVDASVPGEFAFRFRHPNRESDQSTIDTFPERVHLIRWGERRYLLSEDRGVDFVDAMHHGYEPRNQAYGFFLLAVGDEKKPVTGLPELPDPLRALVRTRPLLLRVSKVEKPIAEGRREFSTCRYRIHLDLPRGESLSSQLSLKTLPESGHYATAHVKEIGSGSVVAEVKEYAACDKVRTPPRRGWTFSTGAYPPSTG